jgi:hypothetical protein
MRKHIVFFASLLASIFLLEGAIFLYSVVPSYQAGFRGAAALSLFIAFVHFFIAGGLFLQKKWSPHLGIFFQLYIVLNFIFNNFGTLFSEELLPSVLTVLSVSAFLTFSLFVLRNQFSK